MKILPLVHGYLCAAFLSTAFPLVGLFLYDSVKLYRQGRQDTFGSEKGQPLNFGGRTLPGMTFDIPLHHRNSEKDVADRPVGIQVTQSHTVVVDVEDFGKLKDEDKYSM